MLSLLRHFSTSLPEAAVVHAREVVGQALERRELGFAQLPYQTDDELGAIERLAHQLAERFAVVLVVGIGGSDLGTRAVHRALNHQFYNQRQKPQLYFVADTTDPEPLLEVLDSIDLQQTAVVMVSKSGNTVEQAATFLVLLDRLRLVVGDGVAEHIVAITDPTTGTLRELVNQEGYASLPVPPAVGGRFSFLSAVGLLPLAVTGVPIRELLHGARDVLEHQQEDALRYASGQIAAYQAGQVMHVMMPYTYGLREFGFWFRQLWAESLGKAVAVSGTEIHVGPTPIAALGPTDQHSQVQLYREGPADKTFTFVTCEHGRRDLSVPHDIPDHPALAYLRGRSFKDILNAEQAGTAAALEEVGRPVAHIQIERLDAYHVGALVMFFELATAYAGVMLDINPYDQPGVERGKQITRERLDAA
jgi:glucose-6-phosphate isomerase